MSNNTTLEDIKQSLTEIAGLLKQDFILPPESTDVSFEKYLDTALTRCIIMRDEIDPRFIHIKTKVKEQPGLLPPSIFSSFIEEIEAIQTEMGKVRGYFETTLEEERRHNTSDRHTKNMSLLYILYEFAAEKREKFQRRIESLIAMLP